MIRLPCFTRSLLARSLLTWVVIRAAAELAKATAEEKAGLTPSPPLQLTPPAILFLLGLVVVSGLAFARRRNEDLFLRCLGYERLHLAATIALPVILLEIVIGVAVRM